MEGFLNLACAHGCGGWYTFLAIIPAVITVYFSGEQGTFTLLLLSQVIISMQLPFAVIPLIRFTNDHGGWASLPTPLGSKYWLGQPPG